MKFNNFVASCNIYCVVYRPICWHRSRCHADKQASSTNARDSARCSQTGVFRVHLEDDLMDDSRLIVEVEKQKVIYDPKNLMYKDLQAKEKAWDAVD